MLKKLFGLGSKDPLELKLENIQKLLENKDFEKVISEGEPLAEQVSDKKKPFLFHVLAIAHFQSDNYNKANEYFEKLCAINNTSTNWFNLSTSLIMSQEPQKGLEALDHAITLYQEKGKKEDLSIPYMIFYVLNALTDTKEYNLAFEQLDRMARVYKQISITDTHFLYTRGYVPFSSILEKAKIIMENQTEVNAIEWLNDFGSALDEDGQMLIDEMIADIQTEAQSNTKPNE